ncbi:mechanosensitive ion channel domain-containing protein [Parvibaculum sp.]|jgi:small conductance mechanosensitive channel|uniref:mechanosensitive ion channel family protein n=1 Tax=Parvibaculum sp. TaxID=2024848 RepID=UPI000C386BC2|nr:mechanosensitive ion channel domain-containing protein [Parvibaculum sp.]MAM95780.1 mechanosensitive ion channel protein MscS [Parvibaculum sp.]MBZ0325827.1 mechanosensitive ion channel [Alphaproteobacteria bacterium]HCX66313.1 mechanosensitive ion channel protein MscS [Rhodobiaceae bacterium]|tara:strand:+ start:20896 stop:21732 length:837 start_codon:yes stop_codon:yes gene_type:complete
MIDQLPPAIRDQLDVLLPQLLAAGMNILVAVIILILGFWLAGRVQVWTMRALGRMPSMDEMLLKFFGTIARYLVLTFTILAVLAEFGVQTASLIAVLGAAGLAVGLALQGTLSNVAAGVMLLIFRPFREGHYVEAGGVAGTVKQLSLFTTELATPDNVQIIVPNSDVWGQPITNYTYHPQRRLDMTFGISYNDNIGKAMDIIRAELEADERCLAEPEPFIGVINLGDSSVDIVTRVWVNNAQYWPTKFDLTRRIKERFDENGVTIPFPVRTVYNAAAD